MGARAKVSEAVDTRWRVAAPFTIDIRRDKEGEFFDIKAKKDIEMMILDLQKKDRHLLLMTRDLSTKTMQKPKPDTAKYLCGHDERNWFTCAVPKGNTVNQAKEALKPQILRDVESKEGIKTSRAQKRHRKLNSGRKIHRQGEFMFIPDINFTPPSGSLTVIHRDEPMSRGRGNSHYAEYLYRSGGEKVYVSHMAPDGLTEKDYQDWLKRNRGRSVRWDVRVRNPRVLVKGKITHKEHATLDLGDVWHQVVMNTEDQAPGARRVAFLD